MSDRKWFTPREGLSVVDPHTRRVVPAEGDWVDGHSEFYHRRVIDGDGTLSEAKPAAAAVAVEDGAEH